MGLTKLKYLGMELGILLMICLLPAGLIICFSFWRELWKRRRRHQPYLLGRLLMGLLHRLLGISRIELKQNMVFVI